MQRKQLVEKLRGISDNSQPLFFMLGPCAIENEEHSLQVASFLKDLSIKLNFPLIYKSSFDKANRTSIRGYRSVGMDEGLRILNQVRQEFDVPVVTDIHEPAHAARAAVSVDVLQIPAFLCRQTDLLLAAGKTGAIINVKKGQFVSPEVMGTVAEKIRSTGNKNIWLCERGFAFGYNNLIVDFRNFSIMKSCGYPVVFDATHSVQRPSSLGEATGGDRQCVSDLAISAVAQGIAGIFMEVHEEPERALCDGPNSVRLSQLEDLLRYLIELDTWVKRRARPVVF